MNTSTLQKFLEDWFQGVSLTAETLPIKRPVVLLHHSIVSFDTEANRYYFINCLGQKQYGLMVDILGTEYLLWFLPLHVVKEQVNKLIEKQFSFNVKILSTQCYQDLSNQYSLGLNKLEKPLTEECGV